MKSNGGPMVQTRPLVVVIAHTPLLAEGVAASMDWMADVRPFPEGRPATRAFLDYARPAGIVVEGDHSDAAVNDYAAAAGVPLIRVRLDERRLEVVTAAGTELLDNPDGSADLIADVLAGAILAQPLTSYELNGKGRS